MAPNPNFFNNYGNAVVYPQPQELEATPYHEPGTLRVSDVERLAKAGVKIELDRDTLARIYPDCPAPRPMLWNETPDAAHIWDRWWRAHARSVHQGDMLPFLLVCHRQGDKVHVFVGPADSRDPFILVDDASIFPSDKLMAELHLFESTKP